VGADRVSRFLYGVLQDGAAGLVSHFAWVNGEPGLVNTLDGAVHSVVALELAEGRIAGIRVVMNPAKLRHVTPPR
jgi:RNA polymerase sigma-70 factor (ECF subfamily)